MIDSARPTKVEKKLLLQHYRKARDTLIGQRAHAILLNSDGYSAYEISKILYRTEKTVREWIKRFHQERIGSLFPRYRFNQNAAKLTSKQKKEIEKVLSKPPSDYGIPKEFWDVSSLRSYIKAEFDVEYESEESYRLIFKLGNYSYHLPAKFNIKRDEKRIAERMNEIREEISPFFDDPEWVILVGDETRLVWETIIRRAWLPKGQKTILKTYQKRDYQNFIGFLNLKTGRPHLYRLRWQNQTEVIPALRKLKREYQKEYQRKYPNPKDLKICIIWDNASFHRGNNLKEQLEKGKSLSSIYLINLPPYAPDKNPEEHIWEYAKGEIANQPYDSLATLVREFEKVVMGRNYPYQI